MLALKAGREARAGWLVADRHGEAVRPHPRAVAHRPRTDAISRSRCRGHGRGRTAYHALIRMSVGAGTSIARNLARVSDQLPA